jgi:beta-glucosidase
MVDGIQSNGVGTSLKHFALNNQENERMTISSNVDVRTMREIYFQAFEMVIKAAKPYTVMNSYNRINGEYASDSKFLLTEVLRTEWGFDGFVVTDWGALNNKIDSIKAGCDLEMPTSNGINDKKIVEAVENGQMAIKYLDTAVENILRIIDKCVKARKDNASYDIEEHNALARRAAAESLILLKNNSKTLPMEKDEKIAVIGEFAKVTRYQGGGSSHVTAHKVLNAYDEIVKISTSDVKYSQGYHIESDESDEILLTQAVEVAKNADKIILFIGLPDSYESEGFDREHIHCPANQLEVLDELSKVHDNIIVVMYNGSVVEMDSWRDKTAAIVECWLGGQAVGGAIVDVLYGIVNPSGRLTETIPLKLEDNPSYLSFKPFNNNVNYTEGIYVGYRYYESVNRDVAYAFGYGMSYTTFDYKNIKVCQNDREDDIEYIVSMEISNTGECFGKEVIQLYIGKAEGSVTVPKVQLRAFKKVALEAGETKTIKFKLNKRDFSYFDVKRNDFAVESNDYYIKIGRSCNDIKLEECVYVTSIDEPFFEEANPNSKIGELIEHPKMKPVLTPVAAMLRDFLKSGAEAEVLSEKMIENTIKNLTLRALVNFTGGKFSEENMFQVIHLFNN